MGATMAVAVACVCRQALARSGALFLCRAKAVTERRKRTQHAEPVWNKEEATAELGTIGHKW